MIQNNKLQYVEIKQNGKIIFWVDVNYEDQSSMECVFYSLTMENAIHKNKIDIYYTPESKIDKLSLFEKIVSTVFFSPGNDKSEKKFKINTDIVCVFYGIYISKILTWPTDDFTLFDIFDNNVDVDIPFYYMAKFKMSRFKGNFYESYSF